jgi:multiple sugar transport system ATP-binding protein
VGNANVWLLDEQLFVNPQRFYLMNPSPTLDAALRVGMRLEISELHKRLNTTMIYVTHDQVEAMTMADRIVVMNHGVIEQVGTPLDLYRNPKNLFVAGFIGSPKMNFITGPWAHAQGAQTVGIRPEHISLTPEQSEWKGVVKWPRASVPIPFYIFKIVGLRKP